jgi:hypothetical protein
MAIAMTVGATKIQILQESALTAITGKTPAEAPQEGKEDAPAVQESCFT